MYSNSNVLVFFWKHYCGAPGGPRSAIFATIGIDPLHFGVHRENLLIGNVAQSFFGGFYICWDYVISFSQHFPMRKFSPSPPMSPSPLSHWNSENWLKFGKIFLKNISKKIDFFLQNIHQRICTRANIYDFKNNVFNFFQFFTDFWKKISHFLKKYDQPWVQLFKPPGAKNHIFRIFPAIFGTCILLEKSEKYVFLLQGAWTIVLKVNFPKTWFLTNWHFH